MDEAGIQKCVDLFGRCVAFGFLLCHQFVDDLGEPLEDFRIELADGGRLFVDDPTHNAKRRLPAERWSSSA